MPDGSLHVAVPGRGVQRLRPAADPLERFRLYTPTDVAALEYYVTMGIDIAWMGASDMSEVIGGAHYNRHPDKTLHCGFHR